MKLMLLGIAILIVGSTFFIVGGIVGGNAHSLASSNITVVKLTKI